MKVFNWKSIEFYLASLFLIRLYGIWFPPLETWHSWRQTLTNMMARNMNESGFSLLYPKIDMAGAKSGIIGSEFPLFQNLIASFNAVFGYEHWYGRLIALITATVASWCFYKIVETIWNNRTAWFSTIVFTSSLWYSFSRKTMPDTFAVSLVIIGFYCFVHFVSQRKYWWLIAGFTAITLGGLCKIPAVYLFILVLPFFFNRKIQFNFRLIVSVTVVLSSLIVGWWYFIWVPHLVRTYGFELFFPKGILEGLNEIRPLWGDFMEQIYFGALRSYVALLPLLFGFAWLIVKNNRKYVSYFILPLCLFLVFAIKTGTVFPTHNYYVLPLVPLLAVLVGLGLQRLDYRFAMVLVVLIFIEGIGNQLADFRIKDEVKYRLSLESDLNTLLKKGQKIIITSGSNPEYMYWYHRKGWSVTPEAIQDSIECAKYIHEGARYLVVDEFSDPTNYSYTLIGKKNSVSVYDLTQKK